MIGNANYLHPSGGAPSACGGLERRRVEATPPAELRGSDAVERRSSVTPKAVPASDGPCDHQSNRSLPRDGWLTWSVAPRPTSSGHEAKPFRRDLLLDDRRSGIRW